MIASRPTRTRFSQVGIRPTVRGNLAGGTESGEEELKETPYGYIGMGVTSWK